MAWWRRGGADPAPSSIAAAAPPPAPAPVQRAAWEDLPPIRPVLTATEPVAPLDPFTSSLATARNPSFLAPLAHQVDPAGPSGQVDGLASPVVPQTMSGGPELTVAPRPMESRRAQVAAVVQRALAPRMRFSEPGAAAVEGQATEAVAPAPEQLPLVEPTLDARRLESVAILAPRSLTSAPDTGEFSTLPVMSSSSLPAVSLPSSTATAPTVSRLESPEPWSAPAGPHHQPDDDVAGKPGLDGSRAISQHADVQRAVVQRSADLDGPTGFPASNRMPERSSLTEPPSAVSSSADTAQIVHRSATSSGPASFPSPRVESPSVARPSEPSDAPSYPHAPSSPAQSGSGSTIQAPSVQRAPGLGAPLLSALAVPRRDPEGAAVQRTSSGKPAVHGRPPPETIQRSTPGVGTNVAAHSVVGREPAAAPVAGADAARESPVLGFVELMRVIDEGALGGGVAGPPARPDAGPSVQRLDAGGGPGSGLTRPSARPLGLGAPLNTAGLPSTEPQSIGNQPPHTLQRHGPTTTGPARPSAVPVVSPETPTVPTLGTAEPTTLQRRQSSAAPPEPGPQSSAGAPSSTALGNAPQASGPATELTLPAAGLESEVLPVGVPALAVQRAAAVETAAPALPTRNHDAATFHTESIDYTPPASALANAPLLGAGSSLPGRGVPTAMSSGPEHSTPPSPSTNAVALQPTSIGSPAQQSLQRDGSSTSSPSVAATHSAAGFGAPLPSMPPSGMDRISPREMSFEQMFAPGAAAIASGAAYSDSPNSVVFRSPDSSGRGSNPTLGSGLGDNPMVQRFGLPSVSSLVGSARNAASNYADTARQSVGGLAEGARNSAGSYADSARQAAGGYVDSARQTAGGYVDSARQTAGGYVDSARQTAGGYADQARQTAGGYVDEARQAASGYADQARHTAGGYADQARGRAGSAMDTAAGYAERAGDTATGLLDSARGAAGGLADQAGGALADAGSAAGKTLGGVADSAGGAAKGLLTAAGDAASGAAAAATGAVAGVAGAAAGAAGALPTDLNELARRLFDPMSERFKTELWLDRERAGMITDLRR